MTASHRQSHPQPQPQPRVTIAWSRYDSFQKTCLLIGLLAAASWLMLAVLDRNAVMIAFSAVLVATLLGWLLAAMTWSYSLRVFDDRLALQTRHWPFQRVAVLLLKDIAAVRFREVERRRVRSARGWSGPVLVTTFAIEVKRVTDADFTSYLAFDGPSRAIFDRVRGALEELGLPTG